VTYFIFDTCTVTRRPKAVCEVRPFPSVQVPAGMFHLSQIASAALHLYLDVIQSAFPQMIMKSAVV